MKNAGVAVLAAVSARDLEKALETNKDMPTLAIRLSGEGFVASYHAQSVERVEGDMDVDAPGVWLRNRKYDKARDEAFVVGGAEDSWVNVLPLTRGV